jgi:hypothetical protein
VSSGGDVSGDEVDAECVERSLVPITPPFTSMSEPSRASPYAVLPCTVSKITNGSVTVAASQFGRSDGAEFAAARKPSEGSVGA